MIDITRSPPWPASSGSITLTGLGLNLSSFLRPSQAATCSSRSPYRRCYLHNGHGRLCHRHLYPHGRAGRPRYDPAASSRSLPTFSSSMWESPCSSHPLRSRRLHGSFDCRGRSLPRGLCRDETRHRCIPGSLSACTSRPFSASAVSGRLCWPSSQVFLQSMPRLWVRGLLSHTRPAT
jgi:hypothetical protein